MNRTGGRSGVETTPVDGFLPRAGSGIFVTTAGLRTYKGASNSEETIF